MLQVNDRGIMNYKNYLLKHFSDHIPAKNGEEFRINCINPDHFRIKGELDTKHHLYINIKTGFFICPICNWRGNFYKFVSFVEGLSWREVYDKYKNESEDISLADFQAVVENRLYPVNEQEQVNTNIGSGFGFETLEITEDTIAYKYLVGRGITMEKIKKYRLKYCIRGKYAFRIIIPTYENNKLVYFVARKYISAFFAPKVMNPPKSSTQFLPKNEIVFGIDNIIKGEWLVITEGVFDAMTIPNYGIALLGKYLSNKQFFKIINLGIQRVYVMLDNDAYANALDIGWKFMKWGIEVYVINLNKDEDPNSIGEYECALRMYYAQKLDFETYIEQCLVGGRK